MVVLGDIANCALYAVYKDGKKEGYAGYLYNENTNFSKKKNKLRQQFPEEEGYALKFHGSRRIGIRQIYDHC